MPKVEETKETEATSGRMTSSTIMGCIWDGGSRVNSVRLGVNLAGIGVNSDSAEVNLVRVGENVA